MAIKRFCDRCNKEMRMASLVLKSNNFVDPPVEIYKQGQIPYREFCDECNKSFFIWFKNEDKEVSR